MSTVEYDTACYYSELQDGEETVLCPCGDEVALSEGVEIWDGHMLVTMHPKCVEDGDE